MTNHTDQLALLQRRASELAKRPLVEDRTPSVELLEVSVAGRRLGFEGRHIQQILPNNGMCRLPRNSGALLGLVAARGSAVPVADLGALLGDSEPKRERGFIVLIDGPAPVGLLVDEVSSVRRVPAHDVRARPTGSPGGELERGLTLDGLVVLDTDLLLVDPRLYPHSDHEHSGDAPAHSPAEPHPGEPCPT